MTEVRLFHYLFDLVWYCYSVLEEGSAESCLISVFVTRCDLSLQLRTQEKA